MTEEIVKFRQVETLDIEDRPCGFVTEFKARLFNVAADGSITFGEWSEWQKINAVVVQVKSS